MFKRRFGLPTSAVIGLFVAVSAAVLAWSFTSGFRLNSNEINLAWQANSTRLTVLFAAGFAQCAGLAALKTGFGLSQHIRLYLCLVLTCAALITASIMFMQSWLALAIASVSAVSTFYLSAKLESQTSLGRLVLGVVLYAVFFLSIAVYFAASTQSDSVVGGLVLWLFSNTDAPSHSAAWALISVFVLIGALMVVKEKGLLAISAIALSIGLVGPLMFVAHFAVLVLPVNMELRHKALVAGLLGGTFIVATSAVMQLMFGGYSTALIIPLAFVFIPFILLCSRNSGVSKAAAFNQINRIFEWVLLAIIVALSLAVVLHVSQYAQGLI